MLKTVRKEVQLETSWWEWRFACGVVMGCRDRATREWNNRWSCPPCTGTRPCWTCMVWVGGPRMMPQSHDEVLGNHMLLLLNICCTAKEIVARFIFTSKQHSLRCVLLSKVAKIRFPHPAKKFYPVFLIFFNYSLFFVNARSVLCSSISSVLFFMLWAICAVRQADTNLIFWSKASRLARIFLTCSPRCRRPPCPSSLHSSRAERTAVFSTTTTSKGIRALVLSSLTGVTVPHASDSLGIISSSTTVFTGPVTALLEGLLDVGTKLLQFRGIARVVDLVLFSSFPRRSWNLGWLRSSLIARWCVRCSCRNPLGS